jgi:hypothetical protein
MSPRLRPRVIRGLIRGLHAPFLRAWASRRSAAAARGAASAAHRARLGSAHHAGTSAPQSMIGKSPSGCSSYAQASVRSSRQSRLASRGKPLPDFSPQVLDETPEANACRPGGSERGARYPGLPVLSPMARHDSVCRPWTRSGRGVPATPRHTRRETRDLQPSLSERRRERRERAPSKDLCSCPRSSPSLVAIACHRRRLAGAGPKAVGCCAVSHWRPLSQASWLVRPRAFRSRVSVTYERASLEVPGIGAPALPSLPASKLLRLLGDRRRAVASASGWRWRFGLRHRGGRTASQVRVTAISTHTTQAFPRAVRRVFPRALPQAVMTARPRLAQILR